MLGEFFFRTGCQFGVLGGTYPPKKYSSAPPPPLLRWGSFNQTIPQLSKSPLPVEVLGNLVPSPCTHWLQASSWTTRFSEGTTCAKAFAVCRPLQKKKGKDLKCTVENFVFMCPFTFALGFRKHSASEKGHQWSDSYSYSCRITEQNTGKHLACYKLKVRRFFSHNVNKFSR